MSGDSFDRLETASLPAAGSAIPSSHDVARYRSGDSIGPYQLIEVIGEGGFGVVYLAERREPMVQRVALKVIKPGMDSRSVVARFEQERQALAVMDHPNVARVFDGGVTAMGHPYFVMEHVKGEPITDYCDHHALTLRQRLELFIPVCEAVQHAHHKGIIHRDLKPSNVLITEVEGRPAPKVIDFGIAKAIDHAAFEQSVFSAEGHFIGTPEYMSPEQAGGRADVDTRTDVYSLGVMLYELLVGRLPFESSELRLKGLEEIRRIIREQEPPRPSTRLGSAGNEADRIASNRRDSRASMLRELRRELEWVPLKALRKERDRRYDSPAALADDLRRYLDGRALRAAPESRSYRARKFIRRNRAVVTGFAAVVLALIAGLAATLWQAREASREAKNAEQQSIRANDRAAAAERAELAAKAAQAAERDRADQLKQVSDFQANMLAQVDPTEAGRRLTADVTNKFAAALAKANVPVAEQPPQIEAFSAQWTRVNATDAARELIDATILGPAVVAVDARFKDQPIVDAQLRQVLGDRYRTLGLYDKAEPLQTSALDTRRRLLGEDHPDTIASIHAMGTLLKLRGQPARAEPYYREALERYTRTLGPDHSDTLTAMYNTAELLKVQGKFAEAEPYLAEVLEKRRKSLGADDRLTLNAVEGLAELADQQGKLDQAEAGYRSLLESRRRVLGEDDPDTLRAIARLATLLQSRSRFAEAEPFLRQALEQSRRSSGEDHPDTLLALNNLGVLLQAERKFPEAEAILRESLEKRRRVLGDEHPLTLAAIYNFGSVYHAQGKYGDAEPYWREAVDKSRRINGPDHPNTLHFLASLGSLLQSAGKLAEAEPVLLEAMERTRRVRGPEHPDTLTSIHNYGALLMARGRYAEAEPLYREALAGRRRILKEDHPGLLASIQGMGFLLLAERKLDEAEPYLREAFGKRRAALGEEHPQTLISMTSLGDLLILQGKFDDAITLLEPSRAAARKVFTAGVAHRLASFLCTLGRARVALGYDADRFTIAEADLLEAHPILAKARGEKHIDARECAQGLADLYSAWDAAEPGKGYDAKSADWARKAIKEPPAARPVDPAVPPPAPR